MTRNQINAIATSLEMGLGLELNSLYRNESECSINIYNLPGVNEKQLDFILATAEANKMRVEIRPDTTTPETEFIVIELYRGTPGVDREPLGYNPAD